MDKRRRQLRWANALRANARLGLLGLAGLGALGACNAVLGIEEATLEPAPVPTTGGQGGQAGGGAEGGQGGTPGCTDATECNDLNRCTDDACDDLTRECTYTDVPDGPLPEDLQEQGDCRNVICAGGEEDSEVDDTDLPVDGLDCTEDVCSSGAPSNPDVANGATCDDDEGKICYAGDCVDCYSNAHCTPPETCNGAGTPYECGCTPEICLQLTCGWGVDIKCATGTINCNSGTKNGVETDVDCGGPTASCSTRCNNGKHCTYGSDCASGVCNCGYCGPDGCNIGGSGGTGGAGGLGGAGGSSPTGGAGGLGGAGGAIGGSAGTAGMGGATATGGAGGVGGAGTAGAGAG